MNALRRPFSVLILFVCALVFNLLMGAQAFAKDVKTSPRIRIRLDAGWKFRRDPLPVSKSRGLTFAWTWAPANVKSIESAKVPDDLAINPAHPVRINADEFHGKPGFLWFSTMLGDDPRYALKPLHFEGVDDNAAVYLNGVRLTVHRGYDEPFDVSLAGAWNSAGPNRLDVLVENTAGPGGFNGDVYFATPVLHSPTPDVANPDFDDRRWRTVHLPHDYVVEGKFDRSADPGHGSLPTTTAWYRKTFTVPNSFVGKSVWIDFDGVYRLSRVWLNGHFLGEHPSGYTGFRYLITPYLLIGKPNVLAVSVDPRQQEGWWYEGGGIYRHVWLNAASSLHISPGVTFVRSTPRGAEGARRPDADVTVDTTLQNDAGVPQSCRVSAEVIGPDGRIQDSANDPTVINAYGSIPVHLKLSIPRARLWSPDHPALYRMHLTVRERGMVIDDETTSFGVRTIRFDVKQGLLLNGYPIKIKGTCNHQDHAGVGIALPDALFDWRIKRLKQMGSNAYRMSHNPPATELLDACDRLGMLVMDENRHLGDTTHPKTPSGTKFNDLGELKSMLLRDRNHPSIIMWSMCNEESLQGDPEGGRIMAAMQEVTHQLDPTRPVTSAMSGGWDDGIASVEDLLGVNYSPGVYDHYHAMYPHKPMYGSETASTVSTRGIYQNDAVRGYVSAYDANFPGWAQTAEDAWRPIAERPYMAGGYVWTGFDYKGEPTPYGWPCINSHFGIMDICGFPKDNYYYYQSVWGDKPIVHIVPHWNWQGQEGKPIPVWVYTNGDQVELFLNGVSLGTKPMPPYGHVEWMVNYAPGSLEARATKGGRPFASMKVATTGPAYALRLRTDRTHLKADSEDVTEVLVDAVDRQGLVVPTAQDPVQFSIQGPAEIRGVGNGDPSSHEPDKASTRHAFNGHCMVLVGAEDLSGKFRLTATAPGLKSATLSLESTK